jgi:hypothetical protein
VEVGTSKMEVSRTTNTRSRVRFGECVLWPKRHDMNTIEYELLHQVELEAAISQGPRKYYGRDLGMIFGYDSN